jgi:superfamily II DNA or RNA helicase
MSVPLTILLITNKDAKEVKVRKVPSEGEVVLVRGSYWAVSEVKAQGLPRSSPDESGQIQHLITLSSVSEDRLGDELRVIWELEVGATVLPDIGLPDIDPGRIDHPTRFAAFLDALRWGAITSADSRTLQAPFRSGATVEAYQLEPVRRALNNARANMLLADDVGLGKTIEAGLVIQELLLRHRARTVCVICPAGLAIKWQNEMRDKFGLEFVIINSETMRETRRTHGAHVNPFSLYPRIIVSMQWLPGDRASRLLNEIYENVDQDEMGRSRVFDILVVDEAHHVAPSSPQNTKNGRRGYAVDSQRTRAVKKLAERCEHRLFLTATPHNGYTESFTALLEMIDNRRFVRGSVVDKKNLSEVVVRRLKKTLTEIGVKSFPARRVEAITFAPSVTEIEAYQRLELFLERRKKASKSGTSNDMAALLLKKRFLSSPVSFAYTVSAYVENRGGISEDFANYDEVLGNEADDLEEGMVDQRESITLLATKSSVDKLSPDDKKDLKWLSDWGKGYRGSPDSRLTELINLIDFVVRTSQGDFLNERIVIFTEYVDTLKWILENLQSRGYDESRVSVIMGSTDSEERELIKARFQEHPFKEPVRILLATDAAGEGIDLQNYCHRLVNFDIPFNPNRLEQRAGRIDRYGQKFEPQIFHFVPLSEEGDVTGDYAMLARIAKKIIRQEEDLGPSNEIISDAIKAQLISHSVKNVPSKAKSDHLITLIMQGDREVRKELTELEERLTENRDKLHAHPENIARVVNEALKLDHQPELKLIGDQDTEAEVFAVPNLALKWELAAQNLYTITNPNFRRPITFDPEAVGERTDIVYAHLGHPLVQRASQLLRSAMWRNNAGVNRATGVIVPDLENSIAAAVCRMVMIGKGGIRLHEEIFLAGVRLKGGRALGENVSESILETALDGEKLKPISFKKAQEIATEWRSDNSAKGLKARVTAAISAREAKRQSEITELLQHRRVEDISRVKDIFERFESMIKENLAKANEKEAEAEFLLFDDDEKQQRIDDIDRWNERLKSIHEEQKREVASVNRRYEDIRPFTIPAALVIALTTEDGAA